MEYIVARALTCAIGVVACSGAPLSEIHIRLCVASLVGFFKDFVVNSTTEGSNLQKVEALGRPEI